MELEDVRQTSRKNTLRSRFIGDTNFMQGTNKKAQLTQGLRATAVRV